MFSTIIECYLWDFRLILPDCVTFWLKEMGGGPWILVLYTCVPKETWKKKVVFRLYESQSGVKICLLSRKGSYLASISGRLGVIYQTPLLHQIRSKKSSVGVKLGVKIARNSCLGDVFPGGGKSSLG